MSISKVAEFETQRELDAGSIGASYTAIGTEFYYPMRQLVFINLTDVPIQFTDNILKDKFPLPAGGAYVTDIMANGIADSKFFIAAKKTFYVKTIGAGPSSGSVYVTGGYGSSDLG